MQPNLFNDSPNILPFDGGVFYYPGLFATEEANHYFSYLEQHIQWKQEPIKIFGREVLQPRLTAFYGDPQIAYSYSGITMHPHPWNEGLLEIKQKVEQVAGVSFTGVLLNFYRNGKDSMGWHRDNEKDLGTNPVIGSVSFGAIRTFQLRNYKDKKLRKAIDLGHGSFLLMKGTTQHHWEHQLPKRAGNAAARINLTFRVIK